MIEYSPAFSLFLNSFRFLLALSSLAALSATTTAQDNAPAPTTRFEHKSIFPTLNWGAYISQQSSGLNTQAWEDVTFSTPQILTEFRWSGRYDPLDDSFWVPSGTPNTEHWELSIWEDDGSGDEYGRKVFTEKQPAASVTTEVVFVHDPETSESPEVYHELEPITSYRFAFSLTKPFEMEADKKYWISIQSLASSRSPAFGWGPGYPELNELPQKSLSAIVNIDGNALLINYANNILGSPGTIHLAMSLVTLPINDQDNDGMDDAWEQSYGLDASVHDADLDPDEDDTSNLAEYERKTDPQNSDSDGDGLSDGVETNTGIYVDSENVGSNPLTADSDGDGLLDGTENPALASVDLDQPGTNPNLADSDGDGYSDVLELNNGTNPIDPTSYRAPRILGIGTEALIGNDLTDPENDGDPDKNSGYNVELTAAQKDGFQSGEFFNVFDNRLGNSSRDRVSITNSGPFWIQAKLNEPTVLDYFTISSAYNKPERDPFIWEIAGSNDGETYHTIYQRFDYDNPFWTERSQVVRLDAGIHYDVPPAYEYIRLMVYATADEFNYFQLGELELFSEPFEPVITDIRLVDGGTKVELEWTSRANQSFSLERSEDLKNWIEVTDDIPSAGSKTTFTDPGLNPESKGYYWRVIHRE